MEPIGPRRIEAAANGELVAGLLWTAPEASPQTPLIVLGHGRSMYKDHPLLIELGERFSRHGWNVLAIDAPGHGERRAVDATDWPRPDFDESNAGWHAALELVRDDLGINTDRLAYWGVSMGASLGISLISGNARFKAAVLGLMHPNWPAPPGARLRADAAALDLPVLFLVNWDDTRVPRAGSFELFDLLGSKDKRLVAYPGEHSELSAEAFDLSEDFLAHYLGPD